MINSENLKIDELACYSDLEIYKDKITNKHIIFDLVIDDKHSIRDILERIGGYLIHYTKEGQDFLKDYQEELKRELEEH